MLFRSLNEHGAQSASLGGVLGDVLPGRARADDHDVVNVAAVVGLGRLPKSIPSKISPIPKAPVMPSLSFRNTYPERAAPRGPKAENSPARSEVVPLCATGWSVNPKSLHTTANPRMTPHSEAVAGILGTSKRKAMTMPYSLDRKSVV